MQLGFAECRFAPATRAPHAERFLDWIDADQAGDMDWLEKNPHRRVDPREVLPSCRTVICLALNYFPGTQNPAAPHLYQIARYAWGDDYHDLIEEKLRDLDFCLQELGGNQRYYVDTGPVLERDFATLSGLGWNGKSTMQIHKSLGTWFFLAEILTTLSLPPDPPASPHCGKCTACLDACPTQAITAPHQMEAQRCISYFTIEHKGSIPLEFRTAIGDRLYGCDDCLLACPWNRFAQKSQHLRLHARTRTFSYSLIDFLELTAQEFRTLFSKSPIKRIKRHRFLRNVCVVLGNVGTLEHLPSLQKATEDAHDVDGLIREHALWAISQIRQRHNNAPHASPPAGP